MPREVFQVTVQEYVDAVYRGHAEYVGGVDGGQVDELWERQVRTVRTVRTARTASGMGRGMMRKTLSDPGLCSTRIFRADSTLADVVIQVIQL